jgi:hypothetical protein
VNGCELFPRKCGLLLTPARALVFTESLHGWCAALPISRRVMLESRKVFVAAGVAFGLSVALGQSASAVPEPVDWTGWVQRGETAGGAGNLREAAEAFARARAAAPGNVVPVRAACEVALLREENREPKVSSREPCHTVFLRGGLAEDLRNEVASLLSPTAHPSLDDLVLAALTADAAARKAPDQPWGHVAKCDLARRLGSADVMEACLEDLRRVAPRDPVTKRALALATARTPFAIWALRCLILLGVLATAAHALANRQRATCRRGQMAAKSIALALFLVVATLLSVGAGIARAEPTPGKHELSDFKIDDGNPEASVPSADLQNRQPLEFGYFLQDLTARADAAVKKGDHVTAVRYFRALTKATPTSFAPRRLCEELELLGDLSSAVIACRTAISRQGATVGDFVHFVRVVLAQSGPLPEVERKELNRELDHLAVQAQLGTVVPALRCEVALRFRDTPALEACTTELAKTAPNDPKTVSFLWALAMERNDNTAARQLIDRAKGLGMAQDGVARMEKATNDKSRQRMGRFLMWVISAVLLGLAARAGLRWLATRRRLAA